MGQRSQMMGQQVGAKAKGGDIALLDRTLLTERGAECDSRMGGRFGLCMGYAGRCVKPLATERLGLGGTDLGGADISPVSSIEPLTRKPTSTQEEAPEQKQFQ